MPTWTLGHTSTTTTAIGSITMNETMYTKVEPEKTPSHSGRRVSKKRLWSEMTTPEMRSAPAMPMSSVRMPAMVAMPSALPALAEKSTPNSGAQAESIELTK